MTEEYDVLVIGGGATGTGTALDLALRGLRVALVEQGELASGTSGHYHGVLHSGGRYTTTDPDSARECIAENAILRRIAHPAIADTGGLFVTTPADDPAYGDTWLAACRDCGIDAAVEVPVAEAQRDEPALARNILRAFRVPDGVCDAILLVNALGRATMANRGIIYLLHRVIALRRDNDVIHGALLRNERNGQEFPIEANVVVNAAGPWAEQVAALGGCRVVMRPNKGTMLAMADDRIRSVLNRCHLPGDGDIVVPTRDTAVAGTTAVDVERPDDQTVQEWEVQTILNESAHLVPDLRSRPIVRAWAAVRPLYEEQEEGGGRAVPRTYAVLDHAQRDGVRGLVTVVGGKLTTYRLMAEGAADAVCAHLGTTRPSNTKGFDLAPFFEPPH